MEAQTDYLKEKQDEVIKKSRSTILDLAGQLGELAGNGDQVGILVLHGHIGALFQKAVGRLHEIHEPGGQRTTN